MPHSNKHPYPVCRISQNFLFLCLKSKLLIFFWGERNVILKVYVPNTVAYFLRGSFFRPLKLGRASCGGSSLPPAHIPAVGSSDAKLASLPECSLLLCSFCCLALCLFPSLSLTFLPHLPCGRARYLRDLTHQNQERNAHVFAVSLVSLGT